MITDDNQACWGKNKERKEKVVISSVIWPVFVFHCHGSSNKAIHLRWAEAKFVNNILGNILWCLNFSNVLVLLRFIPSTEVLKENFERKHELLHPMNSLTFIFLLSKLCPLLFDVTRSSKKKTQEGALALTVIAFKITRRSL